MADDVQSVLDCVVVALGELKGLFVAQLKTSGIHFMSVCRGVYKCQTSISHNLKVKVHVLHSLVQIIVLWND